MGIRPRSEKSNLILKKKQKQCQNRKKLKEKRSGRNIQLSPRPKSSKHASKFEWFVTSCGREIGVKSKEYKSE